MGRRCTTSTSKTQPLQEKTNIRAEVQDHEHKPRSRKKSKIQGQDEQESARALMQLAQVRGQDQTSGSNEPQRCKPPAQRSSSPAVRRKRIQRIAGSNKSSRDGRPHQYGPDMTTQQIIATASQDFNGEPRGRRRHRTPLESGQIQGLPRDAQVSHLLDEKSTNESVLQYEQLARVFSQGLQGDDAKAATKMTDSEPEIVPASNNAPQHSDNDVERHPRAKRRRQDPTELWVEALPRDEAHDAISRLGSPPSKRVENELTQTTPYQSPYPVGDPDVIACDERGNPLPSYTAPPHELQPDQNTLAKKPAKQTHFNPNEIARLDAFRDEWCEENCKNHRDFNQLCQSNIRRDPMAMTLYTQIRALFPHYGAPYVQRFCRRRYHNFQVRGTWTAEQDAALRQAVSEKGTRWKAVGQLLERFPEDCRDRWRNYLANDDHRNREQWTDAEILNLAGAVVDCIDYMRQERRALKEEKFGPEAPLSDQEDSLELVNWQAVSDRMGKHGGGRSRLQCSFKWGQIKSHRRAKLLAQVHAARAGLGLLEVSNEQQGKKQGWRIRQAMRKVSNMRNGDKYDLLQAIISSGAQSEGNIPWRSIGEAWWQPRWTSLERRTAWSMLKNELRGHEDMDYRDVVYKLLDPLYHRGINERWDPSDWKPQKRGQSVSARAAKEIDSGLRAAQAIVGADLAEPQEDHASQHSHDSLFDDDSADIRPEDISQELAGQVFSLQHLG